jgi:phenylalanyl-tRNA synthetase beta chain
VKAEHPALHPGRSAHVLLDGKVIGFIGELHPRWLQKYELPNAPVVFEVEAIALQQRPVPKYDEISKFPAPPATWLWSSSRRAGAGFAGCI